MDSRDGSTVDYGPVDVENDFYEPEENPLFASDDQPDDENYEGFTGNAGAVWCTSNLHYGGGGRALPCFGEHPRTSWCLPCLDLKHMRRELVVTVGNRHQPEW